MQGMLVAICVLTASLTAGSPPGAADDVPASEGCPNGPGTYCGSRVGFLDQDTLYDCQEGPWVYKVKWICGSGCRAQGTGGADSCAPSAYVVSPLMEPLVRDLARVPEGAPKDFLPAGSGVAKDHLVIRYIPPGPYGAGTESFELTLWHPSQARSGDLQTDRFAVRSPLPPDDPFNVAFLKSVRAMEARFRWTATGASSPDAQPPPFEAAHTRLLMGDVAGVMEATARAVSQDVNDPSVLRRALVFLVAARRIRTEDGEQTGSLDARIAEATRSFGQAYKSAQRAGSPGLELEAWCVDLAIGGSIPEPDALFTAGAAPCSLSHVAVTLQLLARDDEALALVDRVLQEDPACGAAHHLGAEIIGKRKDWAALLDRVDTARLALPADRGLDARRATALRGLGRIEEARALQEVAARRDPQDAGTMSSLANLTTMTRSDEASYLGLVAACETRPEDLVSCFLAGVVAHYLAHHQDCVDRMVALMDKLPGQPRVPMYAAISSFYLGRQADAERLIEAAARIATAMDPDVYYCRSIIRRRQDLDGAIEDLERFLAVARYGWHSEGKIGRVTSELAMLRKGEIPAPAEAHHRPEGAPVPEGARPGGAGRPTGQDETTRGTETPVTQPPVEGGEVPWLWLVLGAAVVVGVVFRFRGRGE